jgi:hypothetical protein
MVLNSDLVPERRLTKGIEISNTINRKVLLGLELIIRFVYIFLFFSWVKVFIKI